MRYEVKHLGGTNYIVVNAGNYNEPIFITSIVAEAHIVAFALNAIAEGRQLEAWDHANRNSRDYDGPTEGVAP